MVQICMYYSIDCELDWLCFDMTRDSKRALVAHAMCNKNGNLHLFDTLVCFFCQLQAYGMKTSFGVQCLCIDTSPFFLSGPLCMLFPSSVGS